jgi:hypothetical protein
MRNASPAAGVTDVLAGKARTQHIHGFDLVPVKLSQISEVADVRPSNAEQVTDVPVIVGNPPELTTEHPHQPHVQPAVARAEGADPRPYSIFSFFHKPPFKQCS